MSGRCCKLLLLLWYMLTLTCWALGVIGLPAPIRPLCSGVVGNTVIAVSCQHRLP